MCRTPCSSLAGVCMLALLIATAVPAKAQPDLKLGPCLLSSEGSVILQPDLSAAEIESFAQKMGLARQLQFVIGDRLTETATNGSIEPRQPITVTYSFVPDGTIVPGAAFVGDDTSPSDLFSTANAEFPGGADAFIATVDEAFRQWGRILGITFIRVSDDGASFPDSPGELGARGDVRIAMHPVGAIAVAYNYFPNTSDMVLDSEDMVLFEIPTNDFRLLRNVITHEHGHGLGLDHVSSDDASILMEPAVPLDVDGPQDDDIRGAQLVYGDHREANNTAANATDLSAIASTAGVIPESVVLANLAIELGGVFDFYSFTVPDNGELSATVTPVGATYLLGAPGVPQVLVNTTAVHDLAFDVFAPNGTTVIITRNANGIGQPESVTDLALPQGAGTYFIRVRSLTDAAVPQRYSLAATFTAVNAADQWEHYE